MNSETDQTEKHQCKNVGCVKILVPPPSGHKMAGALALVAREEDWLGASTAGSAEARFGPRRSLWRGRPADVRVKRREPGKRGWHRSHMAGATWMSAGSLIMRAG